MAGTTTSRRRGVTADSARKVPCRVATTANITLSGEQTIDGISVVTDDRVLVKDQATSSENGIYIADTSAWTRAPDWDGELDVVQGTLVFVASGTLLGHWRVTTSNPITPGTTSVALIAADTDATLREDLNTGLNTKIVMTDKPINEAKGSDIASATTTDIGAATGNYVDITGTVTITGLGTIQAGTKRTVQFDGALILTHNATSLILPNGANVTTAAGDTAEFTSLGSGNWKCTNYQNGINQIASSAVSGYAKGETSFVENDIGVSSTKLDVQSLIGAVWESVGATGAGATNTWTPLDSVPATAKWIDVKIFLSCGDISAVTILTAFYHTLYARTSGSSSESSPTNISSIAHVAITSDTNAAASNKATARIPITSQKFELYRKLGPDDDSAISPCDMYLIGWGE